MKFESINLEKFRRNELKREVSTRLYGGGDPTGGYGLTAVVTGSQSHPGTDMNHETDYYTDEVIP